MDAGEVVSGGSTLTMQVIRMSRKGKPRNVWQKVIEMILATRLEIRESKENILKTVCIPRTFWRKCCRTGRCRLEIFWS